MDEVQSILAEEFEAIKNELIAKHDELGMRASGNWAESIEVVIEGNNAKIIGEHYSEQLEYGRQPGRFPPSEAIEKWIEAKGISSRIEGQISVSSLAYLIARKIAREGWKREEYGGVELISQIVTPERMQEVLNKVGGQYVDTFTRGLIKYMKEAA